MAEVFYIDSSGLGELVSAFTTVKNSGGQLKLMNLKARVQDLMQLTRMHMVFDIYTDEKAALASFREPKA
jgi:anti-sigma B factor antagonist